MRVAVPADGSQTQFIHSDAAVQLLAPLGPMSMRRASHVEPWSSLSVEAQANFILDHDLDGSADYGKPGPWDTPLISATSWYADMSPVGGRTLGPFPTKDEALKAEVKWLEENKLGTCPTQ